MAFCFAWLYDISSLFLFDFTIWSLQYFLVLTWLFYLLNHNNCIIAISECLELALRLPHVSRFNSLWIMSCMICCCRWRFSPFFMFSKKRLWLSCNMGCRRHFWLLLYINVIIFCIITILWVYLFVLTQLLNSIIFTPFSHIIWILFLIFAVIIPIKYFFAMKFLTWFSMFLLIFRILKRLIKLLNYSWLRLSHDIWWFS